ncbi:MAG: hypothetical protein JNM32_10140 [Dechloromonas sp.]|nr:hypothetical protein [Dechloromonas sp.]
MWPKCLPPESIAWLENHIETVVKPAVVLQPTLMHSDMCRDSKSIEKRALKILEDLRKFERNYFSEANNSRSMEKAEAMLNGMEPQEIEMARLGFSQYSAQFVLLGMAVHMRAIQRPGKSGKSDHLGRHLKDEIAREFERIGEPTGRTNDFMQALTYAIELAGLQSSPDSLVRARKNPVRN